MAKFVPIVSILLALIAAGSIAYIAWELTSTDDGPQDPSSKSSDDESPDSATADDD